jgi:hypothetical protein
MEPHRSHFCFIAILFDILEKDFFLNSSQNKFGLRKDKHCGANVRISASLANASATKVLTVTLKHVETFVDMSPDAKRFILCLERETFVDHVRLKMFHHVIQ